MPKYSFLRNIFLIFLTISLVLINSGCIPQLEQILAGGEPPVVPTSIPPAKTPQLPHAEVVFQTRISPTLSMGSQIYLDILDEVTGLALNPTRYLMKDVEPGLYTVKIPVVVGSVIKYRYTREGNAPGIEYTAAGNQVRYRLLFINVPTQVNDIVSAWNDSKFSGPSGRIQGQVINSSDRTPVPGSLVSIAGAHVLTSSDGSFILEGVPVGKHNLVVYSMSGNHSIFQQEAVIAADSATPATILVNPAKFVNVKFSLTPPTTTISGIPIRLVGNIDILGNTFADLRGGISVLAARAPYMSYGEQGKYYLDIKLPVGFDLRYKYSIGDGFWNAEHSTDGRFITRQLIIPDRDIEIIDNVTTWSVPGSAPVTFSVKVPDNTPVSDSISIQFNPYGWTEPIPMWPLGNNRWLFVLYSPLNLLGNVGYRYCRNDQCGSADDDSTKGEKSQGFPFSAGHLPQNFEDEVKTWAWMKSLSSPPTVSSTNITAKGAEFVRGIEFSSNFMPSWQPYFQWGLQNSKEIGSNLVILTPSWTTTRVNPPLIETVTEKNPLWNDMLRVSSIAKQKGLPFALYPQLRYDSNPAKWWESAKRDENWWQSWFDRYERFIIHHADLASLSGANILIIGDEQIAAAYPNGKLSNGSPSNVPGHAEEFWKKLLQTIRSRYKGKIYWAASNATLKQSIPAFVTNVDGIYVLYTPSLQTTFGKPDFEVALTRQLDDIFTPIKDTFKKPLLLGVSFPSASGAISGCIRIDSGCSPITSLDQPNPDQSTILLDLQGQSDFYNSVFSYINGRSWISGVVSRGYYPPAILLDKSTSIYGKPAGDVVWFWYSKLSANPK